MRRRRVLAAGVGVASALSLAGCTLGADGGGESTPDLLRFRPTAFDAGETVPDRFTCEADDGTGVSPPFAVESLPPPTEAVGLVVEFPRNVGSTFTHWVLWNVPPDVGTVPAGLPTDPTLPSLGGARQGRNGTGRVGYVGLCPPPTGQPAEYWVTLYALRRELDVPAGAGRDAFDDAVETATLASRRLTARFGRAPPGEGKTPTRTPLS
ncbi:MAG: YbhB/YbcL family Raf kinase inhibitor-like protein [Haloarculaceae archaeon]